MTHCDFTHLEHARTLDGIHLICLKQSCRSIAEKLNELEQAVIQAKNSAALREESIKRMRENYLVLRTEILRLAPTDDGYTNDLKCWAEARDCDQNGVFTAGAST